MALDVAQKALGCAAELLTRNLRFILCFDTGRLNEDLTVEERREAEAIVNRLLERAAAELGKEAAMRGPDALEEAIE